MAMSLENHLEEYLIQNQELFYRLAYSYVKNPQDALDIVQESILKAFSSIHSIKNPYYIKTWFYRIIVNESLDFLRKIKREIALGDEYLWDQALGSMDHYEDLDLDRALGALPLKYKNIILLRYFEDLKLEEIAAILDENINTVKTRLYKGLKILRLSMDEGV